MSFISSPTCVSTHIYIISCASVHKQATQILWKIYWFVYNFSLCWKRNCFVKTYLLYFEWTNCVLSFSVIVPEYNVYFYVKEIYFEMIFLARGCMQQNQNILHNKAMGLDHKVWIIYCVMPLCLYKYRVRSNVACF